MKWMALFTSLQTIHTSLIEIVSPSFSSLKMLYAAPTAVINELIQMKKKVEFFRLEDSSEIHKKWLDIARKVTNVTLARNVTFVRSGLIL